MRKCAAMCFGLVFAITCVTACATTRDASTRRRVSRPFEYSGYTTAEYKSHVKFSEYVEMSDGTRLAVDVFLPSGGPERASFPVVFQYTPYTRSYIRLRMHWWQRVLAGIATGTRGPIFDASTRSTTRLLLSHGYAYVIADMRGTGASFGWKMDFMPKIGDDGAELVDWIGRQPWCDGNVGMFGGSYLGYSQLVTASHKPEALKCIFPAVVPLDGYTGEVYPGGIYLHEFMSRYSKKLEALTLNTFKPGEQLLPAAPVVDEDGDGDLLDEIPLDKNGNGVFLDDYTYPDNPDDPPQYIDGNQRQHIYFLATHDHTQNLDYHSWAKSGFFMDGQPPPAFAGLTSYDLSPSAHVSGIMQSGIPIYHYGGWMDGFARGTFELYCTMKKTNPSKVLVGGSYHTGQGPFWEYFGENERQILAGFDIERLRFFDRYLKGINNGIDTEPPVNLYVMNGGGWRFEEEWPLERQLVTPYYLDKAYRLAVQRTEDGADSYLADFTHGSRYGRNNGNRWLGLMGIVPDALPIRTAKDRQCLTYTTDPMAADLEVTGHPIVELWVSSTADYGDIFVYLVDVDAKGRAILVTEGCLRAGFADLHDNDKIIQGGALGIEVLPELPWHGYERAHYKDGILADGKVIKLLFDLQPTSWVFRKGHRIRVSIACADWPTFRLHPKLSPPNDPEDPATIVPTITVYRDREHPSRIDLPVIP
ncbi:MAG: CocE/NonD family hydrolase [Candidatus Abyssubacteria bacterium]